MEKSADIKLMVDWMSQCDECMNVNIYCNFKFMDMIGKLTLTLQGCHNQ